MIMTEPTPAQTIPGNTTHQMITGDAALNALCARWHQSDYLALDTEFIRTTTFFPNIGLIQVNDGGDTSYLVDPLTITDWSAFRALMLDSGVMKIFHSCSEDLQVFMVALDLVPAPIFDTQIAAAFLSQGFGISYQNLVSLMHGIDLSKGETRSDWLQRPLSKTQMQYASLDVAYLPAIYLEQSRQLAVKQRLGWMEEECETLLNQYRTEMAGDFSNFYLNIKGAGQLNRKQLAILKRLAAWREQRARKLDKPRNWIIKDKSLIEIARNCPDNMEALARTDELGKNFLRYEGKELLSLVVAATEMPESDWPEMLPRPLDGRAKSRLKKGQQYVENQAGVLDLPVEVLARKRWLISVLQETSGNAENALPPELLGWRKPYLLPGLLEAMA
jgi:ribonuclease D